MTFEKIIGCWPSTAEFARDIGVTTDLASKYRRERGVPSERWRQVLQAAQRRGYAITADDLMDAQRRTRRSRAERTARPAL